MIGKKYKVLPGSGIRIKRSGSCNFEKLYKELKGVFDDFGYDFLEKEHTTKDLASGRELIIVWVAEREVNDYIKYEMKVRFFVENMIKTEDKYKGLFEIKIWANLELDYNNKWQGNPITEFLFKVYNSYLIKEEIFTHQKKLESDVEKLKNVIRKYIK